MESEKGHNGLSGVLVIVRDGLIFLLFVLSVLLFSILSSGSKASALAETQPLQTPQPDSLAKEPGVVPQSAMVLATPETPENSINPEETAAPQATAAPSSALTQSPVAAGDFSATFPASDTGANAWLSHQDDNLRIAINKVQADGVTYFVADVWVKQMDELKAAFAENSYGHGGHEMPIKIADEQKAVFAVTGDYYGARKEGVVIRNGELYRDVMSNDVCILRRDGTLEVYQKGDISTVNYLDDSIWQAWAFGPALVKDGTVCDTSGSKIKVKNPRCAIGYYAPGHYCFIVVDGRQKGYSEGMTLDELANTFAALGCKAAYNLDGGATAAMVFEGALVNQPTNGGRGSSDIICF